MKHEDDITRHTPYERLPEFLRIEEWAAHVGVGRTLAYELVRRGELEHVRFGRVIRIPKKSVVARSAE